jgi:hypothetical protein
MSSRSPIASNLLLVNPLLNRWKADPQLQSCISKLQQSLNISLGFAVLLHRDAIVTTTKFRSAPPHPHKLALGLVAKRTISYSSRQ